jgi:hypothetical protein
MGPNSRYICLFRIAGECRDVRICWKYLEYSHNGWWLRQLCGEVHSGKTTSTSASKATPARGSVTGTASTSASSSAKATNSSAGSSLVNNNKGSLVVHVVSVAKQGSNDCIPN